jgi:hypothetical protein
VTVVVTLYGNERSLSFFSSKLYSTKFTVFRSYEWVNLIIEGVMECGVATEFIVLKCIETSKNTCSGVLVMCHNIWLRDSFLIRKCFGIWSDLTVIIFNGTEWLFGYLVRNLPSS